METKEIKIDSVSIAIEICPLVLIWEAVDLVLK